MSRFLHDKNMNVIKRTLPRLATFSYKRVIKGGVHILESSSFRFASRTMSSTDKPDHLERTACNTRENVVSMATVIGMRDESKTVKSLKVKVHDRQLDFKAGQWVDMMIPGLVKVGGFSMYSSPQQLRSEETLNLAIKYSEHPPTKWVHTQCKVGSDFKLRVGGDVYFDSDDCTTDLLLIAGGIGINPMLSIMSHYGDTLKSKTETSDERKDDAGKCVLMYSSSTVDELLFKDKILDLCKRFPNSMYNQLYVTKDTEQNIPQSVTARRISETDLSKALDLLNRNNLLVYICGPPPMIHSIEALLWKLNVSPEQIKYEQWW